MAHFFSGLRSGRVRRDGQGLGKQLASLGASVRVTASDVGDAADARSLLAHAALAGVLHAAGVLRDALLRNMRAAQVVAVFASKALAARHLHAPTAHSRAALVLFSSITSALGTVGQANYAAANAHLDALSHCRRAHGAAGCSMQLPLIASAGMGAATLTGVSPHETSGIALALDAYATFLGSVLTDRGAGLGDSVQLPWTVPVASSSMVDVTSQDREAGCLLFLPAFQAG